MLWLNVRKLRSSEPSIRASAIAALADHSKRPEVVKAITNIAVNDSDDSVREAAVSALQGWGSLGVEALSRRAQQALALTQFDASSPASSYAPRQPLQRSYCEGPLSSWTESRKNALKSWEIALTILAC